MITPDVRAQLEIASDEVDMAHHTLEAALHDAVHSGMHSTYTTAIKRIMHFNQQTMRSLKALLADLRPHTSPTVD